MQRHAGIKLCQTALKKVKTAPFPPFSVPSDTVSDGETVDFLLSGASMTPRGVPCCEAEEKGRGEVKRKQAWFP